MQRQLCIHSHPRNPAGCSTRRPSTRGTGSSTARLPASWKQSTGSSGSQKPSRARRPAGPPCGCAAVPAAGRQTSRWRTTTSFNAGPAPATFAPLADRGWDPARGSTLASANRASSTPRTSRPLVCRWRRLVRPHSLSDWLRSSSCSSDVAHTVFTVWRSWAVGQHRLPSGRSSSPWL